MSLRLTIACDGCGLRAESRAQSDPKKPPRAHLIRASLKARGWRVSIPGGADRCPACAHDDERFAALLKSTAP